jgi:hypothetical protein
MPFLTRPRRRGSTATEQGSWILAVLAVALLALPVAAESYIVPMWAQDLPASDGSWWAWTTVTNPNPFPVTMQVVSTYPLRTTTCPSCVSQPVPTTIPPHGFATLHAGAGRPNESLVAGAVEVTTSGPVTIHLVAYRTGTNELRQRLDVARQWLLPGTRTISTVERAGLDWRMNVFIVNPSARDLTVSIWAAARAENEVRATIAAGTTGVVALPPPRCNGVPCPVADTYPPPLLQVHVEADGPFLASVSSIGRGWAVFSLADEAFGPP